MENNFLLEILVQELPYQFIPYAEKQLVEVFSKLADENTLRFKEKKTNTTPSRIELKIKCLQGAQADIVKDVKGPVLSIAINENGDYTPAAVGFAKKNGVALDSLYKKDNYIWAKIEQKGKTAKEILTDNTEALIMKLQGSHFMRWGYFEEKF